LVLCDSNRIHRRFVISESFTDSRDHPGIDSVPGSVARKGNPTHSGPRSMTLRKPKLNAQPVIGVFAPSSPFPEARYLRGRELLQKLGYTIKEPEGLRHQHGYLAGNDAHRVQILHDLVEDEDIDIIWAARGGYGLHRILDQIDISKLKHCNKTFVGFSDICALHALLQSKAGLISIHGPVLTQLGDLQASDIARLQSVLQQEWAASRYESDGHGIVDGVAEGVLVGGCLSVIVPLIGTTFMPPLNDSILLLEDVGETCYRIDRMLTHLRLAGVFDLVAGVALGDFHACEPRNASEPSVHEVLTDILGSLEVPVLSGLPIGHGPRNAAIPLGHIVRLDATQKFLELS
jgi:muramoyltetrapeptide carboxypeptidase